MIASWPMYSSMVSNVAEMLDSRRLCETSILDRKHKCGPESRMLSLKTTETESIQIAPTEAGRLKIVLPYHPDSDREDQEPQGTSLACRGPVLDRAPR